MPGAKAGHADARRRRVAARNARTLAGGRVVLRSGFGGAALLATAVLLVPQQIAAVRVAVEDAEPEGAVA